MQVITLKEHPDYLAEAIRYFQKQWAGPDSLMVYEDSLTHSFFSKSFAAMAAAGQRRNRSRRTLSNHRLRRLDSQRLHQSNGFDPLALRLVCGPFMAWPRRCPPFDRNSQATCCWSWF